MYWLVSFFSRIASRLYIPYRRKILPHEAEALVFMLKIGVLIRVKAPWQLSNYFIPGKGKHTAVYIGDGLVMHSTVKDGTKIEQAARFFERYSWYSLDRPLFKFDSTDYATKAFNLAMENIEYDHQHRQDNPFLDCVETSLKTYELVGHKIDLPFPIYPDKISECGKFEKIYEHGVS